MAKKNQLSEIIPEWTIGGTIDKDDVIAITVAAYEGKLLNDEKVLRQAITQAGKKLQGAEEQIRKEIDQVIKKRANDSKLKAACEALGKAGFGKFVPKVIAQEVLRQDKTIVIAMTASVVGIETNRADRGGRYGTGLSISEEVPLAASHKALKKKKAEILSEIQEIEDQVLQVKKDLSNLARTERQAKAKLAMVTLERSSEGRALLAKLGIETVAPARMLTTSRKKAKKSRK